MQAVLCDICTQPIRGTALELHELQGEVVSTENGTPRITQRGGARMMHLCEPCGVWVQRAMEHLRQAYRESAVADEPLNRQAD